MSIEVDFFVLLFNLIEVCKIGFLALFTNIFVSNILKEGLLFMQKGKKVVLACRFVQSFALLFMKNAKTC